MVVQKVRIYTPHMGFSVLEWFAHESWKFDLFMDTKTLIAAVNLKSEWFVQESYQFDLFLDTKTLIAPVKLKLNSLVLQYCLLLGISLYGLTEGSK